jgi:2-hydroxy-3-keto-5-methylthiopentenyl-1-phosphate phosphatase
MGKKWAIMAIVYDFDGTLSPGNMQEYNFIPQLKMKSKKFWDEVTSRQKKHSADKILTYMHWMIEKANRQEISVRKEAFKKYGRTVKLFRGVKSWFDRVDSYAKQQKLLIEHYIVSSGIQEMIKATPIKGKFKKIFASSFIYNGSGVACWPAMAINYTTKTQFIFRINKGCLDLSDDVKINVFIEKKDRRIPFERMIYIGDGATDVPCMKLVKEQGGHSIAVYRPYASRQEAFSLIDEGRVNFVIAADYRRDKPLEKTVKRIIDKIAADAKLLNIPGRSRQVQPRDKCQRQRRTS